MQLIGFDRFALAASRYRLDIAGADEVINAAGELATEPASGPAVGPLAALTASEVRREDLLPMIDEVQAENGGVPITAEHAALVVARNTAVDIRDGAVGPYQGAKRLWGLARTVPESEETLAPFIHLASEWEDVPDQRDGIEADIKAEATVLAES